MNEICLVVSGGSIKGIGMLGAISYILEKHDIHNINCFIGTSIGAIIGYLLCLNYTPLEIVQNIYFSKLLEKMKIDWDITNLVTNKGFINFEYITEELELLTLLKQHEPFTFKSMYEILGKELCCITYNYSDKKMELLHYKTTPDLPVLVGLRMSASLPFVFDNFCWNDKIYIDGGIINNFPIGIALKLKKKNIIGVVVTPYDRTYFESKADSPVTFIMNLLQIPICDKIIHMIKKYKNRGNIRIIDLSINQGLLNFNLNISEIMEMFSNGYNICKVKYRPIDETN